MMNSRLKGFLQLCRPANLPTAVADVLAGLAIAGFFTNYESNLALAGFLTVLSSIFLYAGGVVLNDVFDINLDKVERPERPIPSGLIKLNEARFFGILLISFGIILSFFVTIKIGVIASLLALLIITYDGFSKKYRVLGPLNMGLCRGCNLLLGIAFFGSFNPIWYIVIPILYIAAITMVSQGEVHGKNKKNILLAGILYAIVVFLIIVFNKLTSPIKITSYLFLGTFIYSIGLPLLKAYQNNIPQNIKKAVKAGVISIILLDAILVVHFSNIFIGLMVVLLLPVSILLAKAFAVT